VFDGRSMAFDRQGRPQLVMASFQEGLVVVETRDDGNDANYQEQDPVESIHDALVLACATTCGKCGFEKVVLGAFRRHRLSGGVLPGSRGPRAGERHRASRCLPSILPRVVSRTRAGWPRTSVSSFREVGITGAYRAYLSST